MGIKKPLIRQAGSARALIGSAAADRELSRKIAYPVLRSIKILCCVSLNGANKVIASELVKRIQEERRKQEAEGRPDRRGARRRVKTISSTL